MNDSEFVRKRLYEHYASTHAARGLDLESSERLRDPYFARLISRSFPSERSASILDLGCGDGALLKALERHGYAQARGIDTSPEQVERARTRGVNVTHGDILAALTELPTASEDVIVAFDLLEHFAKADVLRIADQVHRILRASGRFVVHVPNGTGLFGAPSYFSDLTHETCFTPAAMLQLMAVAGFRDTQIEEDTPSVHGLASGTRWLLWQVLRRGAQFVYAVETGDYRSRVVFSQNMLAIAFK